jgi:fatty-acyl-CoA synthase
MDEDGYLYSVDREKDMIITGLGASNVFCRPVEDVLLSHPSVRAAAVVGVPDPEVGERVHAYVVLAPGAEVTSEDIRQHALDQLNHIWAPKTVEFVSELPMTASDKIDKKALRARHIAGPATTESVPV